MDKTVLYIAGYGRSGSTLLDVILDNHPQCLGLGELCNIFDEFAVGKDCSCGAPLAECAFWHTALDNAGTLAAGRDPKALARLTHRAERLLGTGDAQYLEIWQSLMQALFAAGGKPILVDSSKSSHGAIRRIGLLRSCGYQVKILHLVRNPVDVMRSVGKGSNRRLEAGEPAQLLGGAYRGLVGWAIANLLLENELRRGKYPALRVRFEDLVTLPYQELERIGAFAGFDPAPVVRMLRNGEEFSPGHGTSGNRMRRKGQLRIQPPAGSSAELTPGQRIALLALKPLAARYGYSVP